MRGRGGRPLLQQRVVAELRGAPRALRRPAGHVEVLAFDSARYVGARIGIHDPAGRKVGAVSHLRNTEYLVVAGDRTRVRAMVGARSRTPGWVPGRAAGPTSRGLTVTLRARGLGISWKRGQARCTHR